jgi:AcrR family transcriptional regulator
MAGVPPSRALPRGPHRLAREDVMASQRGRLLDAIAHVVAEKGYGAATVAGVIERAGVSRKTFYEHFRDKETCFLAAYDAGVEILIATMRDAGGDVRAQVRAYLNTLAAEPAFATTFLTEVLAAGPQALERRDAVLDAFASLSPSTRPHAALAAVGAANEITVRYVRAGRTADLPELEDAIVDVYERLLG